MRHAGFLILFPILFLWACEGPLELPAAADGGASDGACDAASACAGYATPSTTACCSSCDPTSSSCQANGCYGGWICDTAVCSCQPPTASCTGIGPGGFDGGVTPPPITGSVGPTGGSVSSLYFAVVGDTRPANPDDTAGYPTTVIEKIYADIEAMSPRPEFVITTGDYMFASPTGQEAGKQLALYAHAAQQFSGPIFAAMGNHECNGATASNCASTPTTNMNAFMNALIAPLGLNKPYYTIPVNDTAGKWTAKIVIAACNAWDATQSAWLKDELGKPTTYTFVVRHEPKHTSGAPCVTDMDALLKLSTYDLFIVGHSHTYEHSGNQVTVGNGGAPSTGATSYGYATITQTATSLVVTQYDYATMLPVSSFSVP